MKVAIVMGSKSDYPVVQKAEQMLEKFNVEYETRIISAHRTPKQAEAFAAAAEENGFGCIIAAAGKAAHLAGVLAATTRCCHRHTDEVQHPGWPGLTALGGADA